MGHDLFRKLRRVGSHIRQGTFADALNERLRRWQELRRQRMWATCQAKGIPFRDRLDSGERIDLSPNDNLSSLIHDGGFEVHEQVFVRSFLREGDVFVDVGANIGLFTLIAAKVVGRLGRVYAFEPTRVTYERLLRNIRINRFRNVRCFGLALSDREEVRTLTTSTDGHGAWNSLGRPSAGQAFERELVNCITWDSFALQNGLVGGVSLMKVDVEGWESYVLEGGEQVFHRPDAPNLLVEFTEANAALAGTSCSALYQRLEILGYQMFRIDIEQRALIFDPLRESYPYENLLATKCADFVSRRLGFSIQA